MSGGRFDYAYYGLDCYNEEMENEFPVLLELNKDYATLLFHYEWYKSGDIDKGEFMVYLKDFKNKWKHSINTIDFNEDIIQ